MIVYLAIVARALFPAALIVGLLASRAGMPRRAARAAVIGVLAAALAGAVAHETAFAAGALSATGAVLRALALGGALGGLVLISGRMASSPIGQGVAGVLSLFLAALCGFEAMELAAEHSFSATGVLNTEAIVNTAGVLLGLAIVGLAGVAIAHAAERATTVRNGALAFALALLAVIWCGELMLAALQSDLLGVTALRVRIVAWVTEAAPWTVYALIAAAVALVGGAWQRRDRFGPGTERVSPAIARRLRIAHGRHAARWRNLGLACTALLAVGLTYQDVYASRPPTLSEAQAVVPGDDGSVRIRVASVADGNLHRFAYIASDGHRVRFFLINRIDDPERVRLGVVFDACMICGDEGYIQDGNEIICIACNVRLFRPSIGKPGGCNPIPLDHEIAGDTVVISAAALEQGGRYFSEVAEIEVADPVSGAKLINTVAPFQYEFRGKTFFFENRDTYDAFRAAPEAYAADTVSRLWRVQGHKGGEG